MTPKSLDECLIVSYIFLSLSTLSTITCQLTKSIASHGKVFDTTSISWLISVPKRWFLHFYVIGVSTTILATCLHGLSYSLALLLLHNLRRYYECRFVHVWRGNSKMYVTGYLAGILHYLLLPWNFTVSSLLAPSLILQMVGVLLCLYSQYEQHMHHRILAKLRLQHPRTNYILPSGRWFEYLGSPQYLAEIGIYLSFLFLIQTKSAAALLFWVVANQSLNAFWTHKWYLLHFEEYKAQNRKALIPYIF
jgi:3-oxo-5-alpha-steroid 4-dehydrogenase 3 / polyprenol reductase